jgi:hypothetical protein
LLEEQGLVRLEWETASEEGVSGFNLYRAETQGGAQIKLNSVLIPATGGGGGAAYDFEDTTVQPAHTYYYWLEAAGADEPGRLTGPVLVIYYGEIFLPMLKR